MRALTEYGVEELEEQFAAWGINRVHAVRVLRALYRGEDPAEKTGDATPSCSAQTDATGASRPQEDSTHGNLPEEGWRRAETSPYINRKPESQTGPWRRPEVLVEKLRTEFVPSATTLAARQVAADGTTKVLLRLADGRTVESVLMPDFRDDRAAGCLSSQVGCAMRCDFCATTKTGFERNLTTGEMVEQFLALRREAQAAGRKLQTIVFMGMGEPMLNLDAVLEAVRRIADNRIGGLGWRQVTVSTVGIIAGIDALTASGLGVNLAVSLHAPDDATRAQLLPTGRAYRIAEILAAADRFQAARGRPVTIQYCLLRGVNDAPAQARLLAEVLGGRRMHVNLLRYNPTGLSLQGRAYEPSSDDVAETFAAELSARGVVAHFRRSRGPDIDAACGQLRRRHAAAESRTG